MGLQLADVENDPLVKDTLKVFTDAIREDYAGNDYGPKGAALAPKFDNPVFRLLLETDSLDSVSAAVLSADHLLGWVPVEKVEKKLNPEVAELIALFRGDRGEGPEVLLEAKNPLAMKLLVATLAVATTGEEFMEMKAEADPMELRMAMAEIGSFVTDVAERLTEERRWQALPPKLLDKYLEGLANVVDATPGKTQKRVINLIIADLKTDMAKAEAEAIAAKEPPPVKVDPESQFEKLKNDARKFKL
ncbi:MAG: hypothetical protein EPN97_16990 [Alphaproteobacteria bacterium]|nr:MAG: hypothetical protein EPN97_16990 [Alphaproteobacteria bacterium]